MIIHPSIVNPGAEINLHLPGIKNIFQKMELVDRHPGN